MEEMIDVEFSPKYKKKWVPGEIMEITWSFNDALGDTMMEKNESLYICMMGLRDKLGGKVERVICSRAWWDDIWINFSHIFIPYQIPKKIDDGTTQVARVHDTYDIYLSDYSGDRYCVSVICSEGIGRIIIKDFY